METGSAFLSLNLSLSPGTKIKSLPEDMKLSNYYKKTYAKYLMTFK